MRLENANNNTDFMLFLRRTRRKKRVKKAGVLSLSSQTTASDADAPGLTRSTDRPLPKRPTGQINGAFEPDT